MPELKGLENNMRIIQEYVPGCQVTLAHIIASPDKVLFEKLGLDPRIDYGNAAIGTLGVMEAVNDILPGHRKPQHFGFFLKKFVAVFIETADF